MSAGRKGASTLGTRLFVTTFPCHYCARHIVSAGVDEVLPSADFCAAVRWPCGRLSPSALPSDTAQISWGKPSFLPRTSAGFTVTALDGYGLCDILPARPAVAASYPVAVRRITGSLHASFRRSLAVPPLRFASASPPSGCTGDFHPQNCRTCPTHRTLRAGSAGACGILDCRCARRSARGQVGAKGWC